MANRLLYLVRHGESRDDELTPVGWQQAELLGARLRDVPFHAIHHSTATRAVQTLDALTKYLPDAPVYPSDLLREFIPSIPDPEELTPAQAEFFESFPQEVLDREGPAQATAALARYGGIPRRAKDDIRELVVSHGNVIRWFTSEALGAAESTWLNMIDYNCSLTVLLYRSGRAPAVVTYNDVGHLPPQLRGTEYPQEWRI
ncbi:histidine phosphatase family protein [Actinoalloteichus caeruleus]|uniref:Phosphoglycerate mutase n=1 Tax=Actinoalloteichus caeruleus DSM 43889 TaxID=1120930 RepID=A0ABT1JK86_ACTCY|nr:histidine phosphatase family protein [Actinoalloteichus caeruleus]MCP2332910.1 putative phosphoglycerate mutase [Actinoalloteichus caeruleus DSM 43889]